MERTATAAEGVVAIGASAGGIEALSDLAAGMPRDFPFAVMIVIHMGRRAPSLLAQIIDRNGPLPAVAAVDGAILEAGRIYAAVPDHHCLPATIGSRCRTDRARALTDRGSTHFSDPPRWTMGHAQSVS